MFRGLELLRVALPSRRSGEDTVITVLALEIYRDGLIVRSVSSRVDDRRDQRSTSRCAVSTIDMSVTDDVGTDYRFTALTAGGFPNVQGMSCFVPTVPDAAHIVVVHAEAHQTMFEFERISPM